VHRAACGTGLALGFVRFLSGEGRAEGRGRAGTEGMCESGVGAGNDGGVDGPGGGWCDAAGARGWCEGLVREADADLRFVQ